ncbi:MAG: CapA family protein [Clostridia bacterium]|nr:CapA family protein [Clostridia bacterium]
MKRLFNILFIVTFILCTFSSCMPKLSDEYAQELQAQAQAFDYADAAQRISDGTGVGMTADFLETLGEETAQALLNEIDSGAYTELSWLRLTGYSRHVIADMISGNINADNVADFGNNGSDSFTVSFVGDILFDPDFRPMVHASQMGGVLNCIDSAVVDYLKSSDVFLINNEFSLGDRGAPLPGKTWTFQVDPARLSLYEDMGVDIVSLANNHVYDYGIEGFEDTLKYLDEAGIPRVGAGMDLGEAAEGYYFIVNGIKVGIVAASCAEKKFFTPVATETEPGVMGTYDTTEFIKAIKAADSQCDVLVAYVHWGTENTTVLDEEQKSFAREYIDAGVDAVIGGHTHCLQGMEFYNGKPIVYSVGNFWFNSKSLDSCVITLRIDKELKTEAFIVPLEQKGCETRLLTEDSERRALFDRVESYEPQGVSIADDGLITP